MDGGVATAAGAVDPWLATTLDTVTIGPVVDLALDRLILDAPVRHAAEDASHSRALAALDTDWPPIYVHRPSMRIVDGVHRVHAARRRGLATIAVRFLEGSDADSFVFAVRANTTFGKPLTLVERERAARRILRSHPQWSDRLIAEACGLSGKTVGALRRRCSSEEDPQLNMRRVGRDGRSRPVNPQESRHRAAALLRESPTASLREVARHVGLSPATVKDVRDRMRRGVPERGAAPPDPTEPSALGGGRPGAVADDAALMATDEGRRFSEWFAARQIDAGEWREFVAHIPTSRIYVVADEARAVAAAWERFADQLESRARVTRRGLP